MSDTNVFALATTFRSQINLPRCFVLVEVAVWLIEAFNARLRAECLHENWFLSLEDAREKLEAWRLHYNAERPHSALGNRSLNEFMAAAKLA